MFFRMRFFCLMLWLANQVGRAQKPAPLKGANVCMYPNVKEKSILRPKVLMLAEHLTKQCIGHPSLSFECEDISVTVAVLCFPCRKWTTHRIYKCCPGWENYQKGKGCITRSKCTVCLPQKDTDICTRDRKQNLEKARTFFQLTSPIAPNNKYRTPVDILFPVLNQSFNEVMKQSMMDPFQAHWFDVYFKGMLLRNNETYKVARNLFKHRDFNDDQDYLDVYNFFIKAQKEAMKPYFELPSSKSDYFRSIVNGEWKSDQVFVEQRLAGLNPMYIQRVTMSGEVGMSLEVLQSKLNKQFGWEKEIKRIVGEHHTLKTAVEDGLLYVVDHPMYYDIPHVYDIMDFDQNDERKMKKSTSPITLYAIGKSKQGTNALRVVAIQMDYKTDSPVYTPRDGYKWSEAKATAQTADFAIVEIYDHLLRTHIRMEPICVCLPRHLSAKHPLFQILKYHCRGLIPVNNYGFPRLTNELMYMHMLFGMGHIGSFQILNDGFEKMRWGDDDFLQDLKRRGVDNETLLPYFPYRDDGKVIYNVLKLFGQDVVNTYYNSDQDIAEDEELQALVNELSSEGRGTPFSGKGMIKGLPSEFKTKAEVADFIFRMIWLVVQHAAINYPISDYGAVTPNMPTKLYDDPRVHKSDPMVYTLPGKNISMLQSYVAMNLGTIRYDVMFDYHKELEDSAGQNLVDNYYRMMTTLIKPMMESTDRKRTAQGHLSYPYLIPNWLPNSIHT